MEAVKGSPLEDLSAASGRDFVNLFAARERTYKGLAERRSALKELRHGSEASIVLMGSWGRAEVTAESDDDFMVLIHGPEGAKVEPKPEEVCKVLDHPPSSGGPFAEPVFSERLVQDIGLDKDDNKNLTRRMLFLLESVPVTGENAYWKVRDEILGRYLDESLKAYRPPRFLLNDVMRYWHTMCVDFAGKEQEGPDKWGLRNAKLRTFRKVLYAGGLLPVLECSRFDLPGMKDFLREQRSRPPTDRIARAFLENDATDAGARTLGAYDEFVGRMNDAEFRQALQKVTRKNASDSAAFSDVRRIGKELQAGLLALLFEAESELPRWFREFAVF